MKQERVLLVDDEPDFTQILARRLESRGVQVDTAASGHEAVEKVKDKSYDAVFLDLAMPGMDGMETLKRLLGDNPDLQVVLLTGHGTLPQGVAAIKLGAMDFLEKPAAIEQLMEKVHQAKAKRMLLVEQQAEDKIRSILEHKPW